MNFEEATKSVKGITAFSDFHAHIFQEFAKVDPEYGSDRFREQCEALQQVFDIARNKKTLLVFAGDLFHKRGAVDTLVHNQIIRVFKANNDVPTVVVRGNHDSKTNSLHTESSLEAFKLLDNVRVVEDLTVLECATMNLICVPYGDEVDEMKDFIKQSVEDRDVTKGNYIVAHVGIEGASTGKESHRLEGAFGTADFFADKVDGVILGHYHKRQFLGGHKNMFYCGNTVQTSFSDEGQDKGVFNLMTGKSPEFVAIDTRKFITINGNDLPDNLDEIIEKHFVRFVGKVNEIKVVREMMEKEGVTNIRLVEEKDYSNEVRLEIDPTTGPVDITRAYAQKYYPNAEDVALECIREALGLA